jgi:colicin import membrane protein
MAVNIAAERVRDAEETGADILVTCCPFCVVNLTQGAKQIGSKIKVMDLAEILMKVTAPKEEVKPADDQKPEPKAKASEPVAAAEAPKTEPAAVQVAPKSTGFREVSEPKIEAHETPKSTGLMEKESFETDSQDDGEELSDDIWTDNSPEALVRRAAWNKGLRCRKDYGEHNIPVAFVKPKVAVFILAEGQADADVKKTLEEDDWIVLSFLEKDITDGEEQAVEIKAAVKENLKALGKKKKKR